LIRESWSGVGLRGRHFRHGRILGKGGRRAFRGWLRLRWLDWE
jgi:hypothetical protein